MKRIFKYPIAVDHDQVVMLPEGAEILTAQAQGENDALFLWARVDPYASPVRVRVSVYGTGHPTPNDPGRYVATVQTAGGRLVWHVYVDQSPADAGSTKRVNTQFLAPRAVCQADAGDNAPGQSPADNAAQFRNGLADLMERHGAVLRYTNDDDGIHVEIGGATVFRGFLDTGPGPLRER